MDLGDQIGTVIAVAVGAIGSYMFGRLSDRDRLARDLAFRWDERRLDAYVAYVSAVKMAGMRANEVHERRLQGASASDLVDLINDLAEREGHRAERFEALPLLADGTTIEAAHELNHALWRLEHPARTGSEIAEQEWHELADKWVTALNNFHAAARQSLTVQGTFSRRDTAALAVSRPERASSGVIV
ncbi:hypothetical protein [Hamadaea tsunoensis]|uniref:hypothetical protein n=1 Tax=Hamadaea tsunoensis TaxID=53368 RepID=UPI0012FABBCC|nr:hypothetical protein [Hamadaea tsunoensis]